MGEYDDGKSRSCYRRTISQTDLTIIKEAIAQASRQIRRGNISEDDYKSKARILMALLDIKLSSGD